MTMKVTQSKLKQIIAEELAELRAREGSAPMSQSRRAERDRLRAKSRKSFTSPRVGGNPKWRTSDDEDVQKRTQSTERQLEEEELEEGFLDWFKGKKKEEPAEEVPAEEEPAEEEGPSEAELEELKSQVMEVSNDIAWGLVDTYRREDFCTPPSCYFYRTSGPSHKRRNHNMTELHAGYALKGISQKFAKRWFDRPGNRLKDAIYAWLTDESKFTGGVPGGLSTGLRILDDLAKASGEHYASKRAAKDAVEAYQRKNSVRGMQTRDAFSESKKLTKRTLKRVIREEIKKFAKSRKTNK